MTKVKLIGNLTHDGVSYTAGDIFEGDKATVDNLIALGAARDPKAVEPDLNDTAVEDAEAKANEILEAVQAKVQGILADAQAEANKITDEAKDLLATATADAEQLVADAQAEAAKIAEVVTATPKAAGSPQKQATTTASK